MTSDNGRPVGVVENETSQRVGAQGPPPARSFGHQVAWSLVARAMAAVLQILVLVLLARGLEPVQFALVSAAYVALNVVVAINGFGLLRQIEFRRSRDPLDPSLPGLFALRLRFSYASATLWAVVCLALWLVTGHQYFLALTPAAVWLLVEQTTQIWNGISVVDGHAQHLVTSYLTRRLPVVLVLAVALAADLHVVWSWTVGLAVGSFLSYAVGWRRQEPWARIMWPRRRRGSERLPLDLGYWWGLVGFQIRDLDVAAVSAVSAAAGGFYAFPARLVSPLNLVTLAAGSVAFPRVARDGITRAQLRRGTFLGTLPVLAGSLTVALLAPFLPLLLGSAYAESVPVLRITCVTAVLTGIATLLMILMQARSTEDAQRVGYLSLAFGALQVASTSTGALVAGAVGAASGAAAAAAVITLALWVDANRRVGG